MAIYAVYQPGAIAPRTITADGWVTDTSNGVSRIFFTKGEEGGTVENVGVVTGDAFVKEVTG